MLPRDGRIIQQDIIDAIASSPPGDMSEAQQGGQPDVSISAFVDPMTHQPFDDPVVAEDGHTYSRQSILDWFATCEERRVPITSPLTTKPMGKTLRENLDMKAALDEYLQQRRSAKFRTESDETATDVSTQMNALAIGDGPASSGSDSPEKEGGSDQDMNQSQKTSYKTALCRFFEQSRCERGSNCTNRNP